jgi:hypothetical protein
LAIKRSSVEGCQFLIDPDGPVQCPAECAARHRALEAGEPTAGVSPAAGQARASDELAVVSYEP